jgi:lambda family phage portal protein
VPDLEQATDVPYSIELLEADMVPMTLTAARGLDGQLLRYGILTDQWGKPEEYLVMLHHPGDLLFGLFTPGTRLGTGSFGLNDIKRVPAMDISHIKHVKRMHQTRGVSALATVFNRLTDLKDYEESEQTAARIGSYVALAITKSPDAQPEAPGSSSPREMDWMPGMIFDQLVEGEEVKSIENKRPSNKIMQFRQSSLMAVSSGTRAGYSSIAKDFNGTYSAQRQELVESELHYAVLTEEIVSTEVRPIYRRFVDMVHTRGLIPLEMLRGVDLDTLFKAAFRGPAVAYIDPVKEINAELIGVQASFFSKQSVQLKRGNNPNDVDAEIEQERKREKDKGIVSTSNPANKTAPATAALPAVDEDDEDAEAEDGNGNRYVCIGGKWVPQEMAAVAESLLE